VSFVLTFFCLLFVVGGRNEMMEADGAGRGDVNHASSISV